MGNSTEYSAGGLSTTTQCTHLGQPDIITQTKNGTVADAIDYAYNAKDQLVSKTTGNDVTSYSYNAMGSLTSLTSPSGLVRNYTRDSLERITSVSAEGKQFGYEYYGDGLIMDTRGRFSCVDKNWLGVIYFR